MQNNVIVTEEEVGNYYSNRNNLEHLKIKSPSLYKDDIMSYFSDDVKGGLPLPYIKTEEDFRIRNQVTKEKHMARLNEIHDMAKQKGQLHTAMNAEVYRGKAAGLYVERKLIANKTIEDLSEEQLEEKLQKIEDDFGVRRVKDETE